MKLPRLFDAHFHIIDPLFPLFPNAGFLPAAYRTTNYLAETEALNIRGGAVVSSSFHRYDQDYLRKALGELGPGFFGVTQLFGTDLPGTRTPRRFHPNDIQIVRNALEDETWVRKALWDNAERLYMRKR
jgi:predicted TIM-barrel fold metal-dependent hydrolase